jgi:hypothetical protein
MSSINSSAALSRGIQKQPVETPSPRSLALWPFETAQDFEDLNHLGSEVCVGVNVMAFQLVEGEEP